MSKAIGGYFELELAWSEEYHKNAIRLNTGRNAFEYILRAKQYKKVYLPYFTCDVMLEPIRKLNIEYQFYSIDSNFKPIFDFDSLGKDAVFVYTNYYGVCDSIVKDLSMTSTNLIIDNAQAFFSKSHKGIDTFYSPRKFFGLPDGSYLYMNKIMDTEISIDISYKRFNHLLGRFDLGAEKFYNSFRDNDKGLAWQPIKQMSKLTHRLLTSIDYDYIKTKRRNNFLYLHKHLSETNKLSFNISDDTVPMVYPYLVDNGKEMKAKLIENKVFVATYWPNVLKWAQKDSFEYNFTNNLLALPIDQRYGEEEMNRIIEIIKTII